MSSRPRFAITSLTFMWNDVPAPAWKTSTGNCASNFPSAISWAADSIARASFSSTPPSSRFARAHESLRRAYDRISRGDALSPLTGKFSTARSVWIP